MLENKDLTDSMSSLSEEMESLKGNHERELEKLSFDHEKSLFEKEKELQVSFQNV